MRIEAVCSRFEAGWRQVKKISFEAYLSEAPEQD
jgi:hypothetical protein